MCAAVKGIDDNVKKDLNNKWPSEDDEDVAAHGGNRISMGI